MIVLMIAALLSLLYSLFLTPLFTKMFVRLKWGQFIRGDGPASHHVKRGTPTMGGIVFLSGSAISYFLAKLIMREEITISALLVIFLMLGLGLVGFIDDFLKTHKQQSLGLGGWSKVLGQVLISIIFAIAAVNFPNEYNKTPASFSIHIFGDLKINYMQLGIVIPIIIFSLWSIIVITSTSNSVNLTDGLDGLATGTVIIAILAYVFIAFWQFNQTCANSLSDKLCYETRDPLDLAVISASVVAGLAGFLWWNTNPAHIYMGDTGSLGLGGLLSALAILTHTELLFIVIGFVFVAESGSVILQRIYYKITGGRRIFLMSPIHHHFELKGWQENKVVVRFWLISTIFALFGVALFYSEWVLS